MLLSERNIKIILKKLYYTVSNIKVLPNYCEEMLVS